MSRDRIAPEAGFVNAAKLPRGPNGRALCRQCSTEVPKSARTFCNDGCVHEWKIKTNPGYVRDLVWARDKGVCALCRLNTGEWLALRTAWDRAYMEECNRLHREWRRAERELQHRGMLPALEAVGELAALERQYNADREAVTARWKALGLSTSHAWEADHTTPVVEGGGGCGLDGFRTLCIPCHRRETAGLARRRAEARREAKQPSLSIAKAESKP